MAVLADSTTEARGAGSPVDSSVDPPVSKLGSEFTGEVMQFLSRRPKHTFGMQGLIRDNGLDNPLNRGTFYGCRSQDGELTGVALIGHHILFEAVSDQAVDYFARIAKQCKTSHMLLGEADGVQLFWNYYREDKAKESRCAWRELFMELDAPVEGMDPVPGLRNAVLSDLDLIIPVHAEMALEESGVDPLQSDPEGFKTRCARRVQQDRVWIWVEDNQMVFKAEVVSYTDEMAYIEGVWVNPHHRGRGYLARCLSQMARQPAHDGRSLSILVNENKTNAIKAYTKAGFKPLSHYTAIFL